MRDSQHFFFVFACLVCTPPRQFYVDASQKKTPSTRPPPLHHHPCPKHGPLAGPCRTQRVRRDSPWSVAVSRILAALIVHNHGRRPTPSSLRRAAARRMPRGLLGAREAGLEEVVGRSCSMVSLLSLDDAGYHVTWRTSHSGLHSTAHHRLHGGIMPTNLMPFWVRTSDGCI